MLLGVVDESEWRYAAGLQTEIAHHAFGRGETEFTGTVVALCHQFGLEAMLEVVDIEVVVAMEANEVVLVALVVAEEDVFAMHGAVVFPPALGFFDGLALGVIVHFVCDLVLVQIMEHCFLSCHFGRINFKINGRFHWQQPDGADGLFLCRTRGLDWLCSPWRDAA